MLRGPHGKLEICLGFGSIWAIVWDVCARVFRVVSEADAQGFEKGQVVPGERPVRIFANGLGGFLGFCLDLVEADRSLKHKKDIKTLLADVFDDAGDVFRLGDRLVDRLTKLLNKVFDLLIQCHLRTALWLN